MTKSRGMSVSRRCTRPLPAGLVKLGCAAGTVAVVVSVSAWAGADTKALDEGPWSHEHVALRVGAFWPTFDTNVRLDGAGGMVGTDIDFESILGLDDRKILPNVELTIRLGRRHRLDIGYLPLSRSSGSTLISAINFGDQTFATGTGVRSEFDLDLYHVAYGFSFMNNGKRELGVSLGLHVGDIQAGIRDLAGTLAERGDIIVPLPNAGIYGGYALTRKLALLGSAQVFWLKAGQIEGQLIHLSAALEHYTLKHLGFGVGYSYFDLNVDATASDFSGEFDFKYHGPVAYATLRF